MITRSLLRELFESYTSLYPEERDKFPVLAEQLKDPETDITTRKNFRGHVVADWFVFDSKKKKALLIYHAAYHHWQNPGGHIESDDEHPADAAFREVLEETGVRPAYVFDENRHPMLLHIDSHIIPASEKKWEPEHWHHGMTFLFLADSTIPLPNNSDDGIERCQWIDLSEASQHERIARMLDKIELF